MVCGAYEGICAVCGVVFDVYAVMYGACGVMYGELMTWDRTLLHRLMTEEGAFLQSFVAPKIPETDKYPHLVLGYSNKLYACILHVSRVRD